MNTKLNLAAGALALAAASAAPAATLSPGAWAPFDVDALAAVSGGLEWIDIATGVPLVFDVRVPAGFVGTLTVVDAGFSGDRFTVMSGNAPLGDTSAAVDGYPASIGLDFAAALADDDYSRGVYMLAEGSHRIGGTLLRSALAGGEALDATVGGVLLLLSAVPEPASWATLAAGLAVVGAAARRRG